MKNIPKIQVISQLRYLIRKSTSINISLQSLDIENESAMNHYWEKDDKKSVECVDSAQKYR